MGGSEKHRRQVEVRCESTGGCPISGVSTERRIRTSYGGRVPSVDERVGTRKAQPRRCTGTYPSGIASALPRAASLPRPPALRLTYDACHLGLPVESSTRSGIRVAEESASSPWRSFQEQPSSTLPGLASNVVRNFCLFADQPYSGERLSFRPQAMADVASSSSMKWSASFLGIPL